MSAAAEEDPDAALEARLAAFKGARSWKQEQDEKASSKAASAARAADKPPPAAQPPALDIGAKPVVDWGSETVFFDAPPSRGDLVVNVLLGATLLWLPLSIAAVGRGLWVRYKVTDKRVSVASTSPFGAEELNASYGQMTGADQKTTTTTCEALWLCRERNAAACAALLPSPSPRLTPHVSTARPPGVVAIGRGVGVWGDMVISLADGSKIEIRSIDRWAEVKAYIEARRRWGVRGGWVAAPDAPRGRSAAFAGPHRRRARRQGGWLGGRAPEAGGREAVRRAGARAYGARAYCVVRGV